MNCGKTVFFNNGKLYIQHDNGVDCVELVIPAKQGPAGGRGVAGAVGPAGPAGPVGFIPFGNDTGVPDVYTTVLNGLPSNVDGFTFEVNIETGNDNTGASTLDIGLGALPIVDSDLNPLEAGMLEGDSTYLFVYNSTGLGSYQLLGLARPSPQLDDIETGSFTLTGAEPSGTVINVPTLRQAKLIIIYGSRNAGGEITDLGCSQGEGNLIGQSTMFSFKNEISDISRVRVVFGKIFLVARGLAGNVPDAGYEGEITAINPTSFDITVTDFVFGGVASTYRWTAITGD